MASYEQISRVFFELNEELSNCKCGNAENLQSGRALIEAKGWIQTPLIPKWIGMSPYAWYVYHWGCSWMVMGDLPFSLSREKIQGDTLTEDIYIWNNLNEVFGGDSRSGR